jgi:hypothetical protein
MSFHMSHLSIRFLFGAAVAQFIVSTVHIANAWRMLLEAFIWNAQTPGASIYYWVADPSRSTEIICKLVVIINVSSMMKDALNTNLQIQACLADSALVWRLYMIWNKNIYVCIMPVSLRRSSLQPQLPRLISDSDVGDLYQLVLLHLFARADCDCECVLDIVTYFIGIGKLVHLAGTDLHVVSRWLVAGLALSLVANTSVTCLIAGRLWVISRSTRTSPVTTRCTTVVWTILQSGAVYSITMVFLVAFTAMESQVGRFISNLFVQLCVSPIFNR